MTNQTFEVVGNLAKKLLPDLLNFLIYQADDGRFILYDEYYILKSKNFCSVHRIRTNEYFEFSSLRNATTWCTLDWFNKINEARQVMNLDKLLTSVKIDKQNHTRLKSKGTLEQRSISSAKLLSDIFRQKQFQAELDKYIILARKCQEKGFKK